MAPVVAEPDTIQITDLEELFGEVIPCEFTRDETCQDAAEWRVGDDCCWLHTCTKHKDESVEIIRRSMKRKSKLLCVVHKRVYRATMLNVTEL